MALEISYWTASRSNPNVPGAVISAETRSLSASSAQSGVTPANAVYVKINATEAARFEYSSANPTAAATSAYLASGEALWLDAVAAYKIAGITG